MRRRRGLALATTVVVLAAGGVVGQMAVARGWLPLAPGAGSLFAPRFIGERVQARPLPAWAPPQHPHMAADGRNSMHNDAYATDAYPGPGPLGRNTHVTSAFYGVSECATLTFDRAGRLVGLCGGIQGPQLKLVDPESLTVLAAHDLPGRRARADVSPLEDLCGGAYFYLDNEDRAVVATTDRSVRIVRTPSMATFRDFSLDSWVRQDDCLIALMPDWSGRIWFVSSFGAVGALDPASGQAKTIVLPGERIANSFAVDQTGGVFIVSDHALYRFDAGGDNAPAITWRRAYDRGGNRKPGQLSQGSGTTPTLTAGGLVAITDNAEPRMNVLAYDRKDGRLVCGASVFGEGRSATDNSLVAVGDSLLVENNYGYSGPLSTLGGGVTAKGVARVDVTDGKCVNVWESAERAPSSVPKASYATGLLYVYTKASKAWYLTAIDVRSGRTAFQVLTGVGVQWNNHYSAIALGPDGSVYLATLFGLVRIYDTD
jgi:hypothetical protein